MNENLSISKFAVSVFSRDGTIVSSSTAHAALVGREPNDIVGRNWREWNIPDRVDGIDRSLERAFAGEPTELLRTVVRPDGSSVISPASIILLPRPRPSSPLVIALSRAALSLPQVERADALSSVLDVAEYVSDLTEELSAMSDRAGLVDLGGALDEVAAYAGRLTKFLHSVRTSQQ